MTTVRIYKSQLADCSLKVRYGHKHGRARGGCRKRWIVRDRLVWNLTVLRSDAEYDQTLPEHLRGG